MEKSTVQPISELSLTFNNISSGCNLNLDVLSTIFPYTLCHPYAIFIKRHFSQLEASYTSETQ